LAIVQWHLYEAGSAAEPQMKVKTQSAKLKAGCAVRESHKGKSKGKGQK
jgi:hypothetical protein